MALMPKRVKWRKSQRGKLRGVAMRGNEVSYGEYGLQTLGTGWITGRQIEAGRVAATHFLHREGRVYIRIFPHKPVSAKPLETRMGKGKGDPEDWVACVREGQVLFEVGGVEENVARSALGRIASKMPMRCRMIRRRHGL
ncbi:MAG: 50S ribosomal protein L16 [Phycisphaerae bacterium]|nr:MAG: 50S ribosomal protein L16 [Planctomycetota bacterium]KAB2948548.1 MAG: 50S ribosomal protein L16 [Phycisphaerae bacterium]MBE7458778.1 50S ribosomal protein L16 [Planctomycetia bacterium]MCG3130018.1 50S ribosomal protein L16 [Phycisphaerae bacterium]MCK6465601.1 50S ribosomal protein L16 [Phycisphaerae bacterium]